MDDEEVGCWEFPTDVLVEILQRLPPSSRRRSRLVCRHWRDAVDERTTEMRSRAKLLIWDTLTTTAYVVDDMSASPRRRPRRLYRCHKSLVGTCNGLLCLCGDERAPGGGAVVTVVNPSTCETLAVPPPPRRWHDRNRKRWHEQYSFAYHPITGRYKVVHLPCSLDPVCSFNAVHVFTLGETAWLEAPVGPGGARCNLAAGVVSVDGTTHWVRIMPSGLAVDVVSFDLGDERVAAAAAPLPTPLARDASYHLTEVLGRLGFVQGGHRADVWVLEEGRRWSFRYILGQPVPRPQFTYPGQCVLTVRDESAFYAHWWKGSPMSSGRSLRHDDVIRVGYRDEGTLVANMVAPHCSDDEGYQTFAYVETKEPLHYYGSS
jgi:F-box interacting protein